MRGGVDRAPLVDPACCRVLPPGQDAGQAELTHSAPGVTSPNGRAAEGSRPDGKQFATP
jgi:hypothetical protein